MRNGLEVIGVKYTVELLPLKVVWRFRYFPTTFTGKKFANRVHRVSESLLANKPFTSLVQVMVLACDTTLQTKHVLL